MLCGRGQLFQSKFLQLATKSAIKSAPVNAKPADEEDDDDDSEEDDDDDDDDDDEENEKVTVIMIDCQNGVNTKMLLLC